MKTKQVKVPIEVYEYFKRRRDANKSASMASDIGMFFRKFHKLRSLEKKLEGKRVLIFK